MTEFRIISPLLQRAELQFVAIKNCWDSYKVVLCLYLPYFVFDSLWFFEIKNPSALLIVPSQLVLNQYHCMKKLRSFPALTSRPSGWQELLNCLSEFWPKRSGAWQCLNCRVFLSDLTRPRSQQIREIRQKATTLIRIGTVKLQHTSTNCYLGLQFNTGDSFKLATEELRKNTRTCPSLGLRMKCKTLFMRKTRPSFWFATLF